MPLGYIVGVKTVTYTAAADKVLRALPPDLAARIEDKVERYALTGEGDPKALVGADGFRLRVGAWRIICTEDLVVVNVVKIGQRGQIYR